ncbi:MAG: hypothetical protein VYA67_22105 [Actinomycetota bacterium]|nr:hypothetical protein [Actinomycetota bacterium]
MSRADSKRRRNRRRPKPKPQHPQPTPEQDLNDAIEKLRAAIANLIDPRPLTTDDGTQWLDSLYDQLTAAIPGQFLGRYGLAKSQPPLWIAAIDTLNDIDTKTRTWQPNPNHPTPTLATYPNYLINALNTDQPTHRRLHLRRTRTWTTNDTKTINTITNQITQATQKIETLFTENHTKHLPAPCPACEAQIVYRTDDAGERVRQPALQITTTPEGTLIGCQCQNCKYVWGPERFRILAQVLGYPLPEGVLE